VASTRRDPSIDVIRGMCVASMVIAHIAASSVLYKLTHVPLWIDGATGFVLLAGLVIGMVQARAASLRQGLARLGRRTLLVYAAHVGLIALAIILAPWDRMAPQSPLPAAALGGWRSALWLTLTLRINPINLYILSLYVVLFAVAGVAVALLRRGHPWVLATASAAVYVSGLWAPAGWATLPQMPGVESFFDLAGWQALFVSGLFVGWYWRAKDVAAAFDSRRLAVSAGVAVVVLCAAAQLVVRGRALAPTEAVDDLVAGAFEKSTMGPGRLLLGWSAFAVLYYLLRHARPSRPLDLLVAAFGPVGRRSLDAFVLMCLADIILAVVAPYRETGPVGMAWAGVVLAVISCWARWRDRDAGRATTPSSDPGRAPATSSATSL
jgi:hypothetical protein